MSATNDNPIRQAGKEAADALVREAQMAAIARFASLVAHDLRNSLGVIRNAAFLLKRKLPPQEAKWLEYLDMIEQETMAADRTLSELSAVGRDEPPVRRPVALGQVIARARAGLAAPPDIQWDITCDPEPLVIAADAEQWEEVFRHLFQTSLDALGATGRITVAARRTADHDEITVSDDGPQIPAEVRSRAFEPLFPVRGKRSGLGLTIAQRIIERHGGTIELLDQEAGAAFRIRLRNEPRSGGSQ